MTCWKCGHEWKDFVGAWGDRFGKGCIACAGLYWSVNGFPPKPAPATASGSEK